MSISKQASLEDRLQRYLHGILPSHIDADIEVLITPYRDTAAVVEADDEKLDELSDDLTPEAVEELRQLDADYAILVSDSLPPYDASNFEIGEDTIKEEYRKALVLHEVLHILKTAILEQTVEIEQGTEDAHFEVVDALGNIVEDGMIERECRDNPGWSDVVNTRLDLGRQLTTTTVETLSEPRELTLIEAVRAVLFDQLVWRRGYETALRDPTDDRVQFASPQAGAAFAEIEDELYQLIADLYQLRSDDPDPMYVSDKTVSVQRMKRIIQFWNSCLAPLFQEESTEAPAGDSTSSPEQSGETTEHEETPEGSQSQTDASQQSPDNGNDETQAADADSSLPADADGDTSPDGQSTQSQERDEQTSDTDSGDEDSNVVLSPDELEYDDDLGLDESIVENPALSAADDEDIEETDLPDAAAQTAPDIDLDALADAIGQEEQSSTDGDGDSEPQQDGHSHSEADDSGDEQSESSPESAQNREEPDGAPHHDASGSDTTSDSRESTGREQERGDEGEENDAAPDGESVSPSRPSGQATFGDFQQDSSPAGDAESEHAGENNESPDSSESGPGPEEQVADSQTPSGDPQAGSHDSAGAEGAGSSSSEQGDQSSTPGDGEGGSSSTSGADTQTGSSSEQSGQPGQGATDGEHGQGQGNSTQSGYGRATSSTDQEGGESPASQSPQTDTRTFGPSDLADLDSTQRPIQPPTESEETESTEHGPEDDGPGTGDSGFDSSDSEMPETFAEILDDSPVSLPDAEQTFRERINGAGSDNLDALRTPSQSEYGDKSDRWDDISEGSYRVESVLDQELDIERRATRTSGLTTGRFDPTLGWKLGIGETRVFSGPDTGEEKRYHLIFVLDRSYSMRGENIEAATKALATFSHAAEELGIAVSVLDFYDGSARWIKPAVMPTQLAQQALLSTATAGGTPLSDALEMAHSLVNLRDEKPIVITLTDGLPGEIGQTEDQIDAMTAPVCSITVALDEPSGSLPQKADRLEDAYFRSATVWTKDELIDKLEKFAGLLSGL